METLDKNAELNIYGYFEDIKRKVDLRREDLIESIHNYSDEIIKSITKVLKDYNDAFLGFKKYQFNFKELETMLFKEM